MKKNQTLITILVALGLGGALYFILRGRAGRNDRSGGANSGGGGWIDGGGVSNINHLEIANNLFDIFNGYGTTGWGADDVVAELKKLKTRADWDALVKAYGVRTVSSGMWNIFQSDFTGTLVECMKDELDSSEEADVNDELKRLGVSI